jgi:hypothetical protein
MSALPCPKCREIGFTWAIDSDNSRLTQWRCSVCPYRAEEDEAEQPALSARGKVRFAFRDVVECYLYCSECRSRTPV